jgi:hypothetical protein
MRMSNFIRRFIFGDFRRTPPADTAQQLSTMPESFPQSFSWGGWIPLLSWGGLVFNIIVNVSIVYGSLPVFFRHDNIGPSAIFYFIGLFIQAVVSILIGFPCAILAIKKERRRIGWLGIVLAITPVPLSLTLLKTAMYLNGLKFD